MVYTNYLRKIFSRWISSLWERIITSWCLWHSRSYIFFKWWNSNVIWYSLTRSQRITHRCVVEDLKLLITSLYVQMLLRKHFFEITKKSWRNVTSRSGSWTIRTVFGIMMQSYYIFKPPRFTTIHDYAT